MNSTEIAATKPRVDVKQKSYFPDLEKLRNLMDAIPNTRMGMTLKVMQLIILNMRYEKIAFKKTLSDHPYTLTHQLVLEAIQAVKGWKEILFIESQTQPAALEYFPNIEDKHQGLFNILWDQYGANDYETYIDRYRTRIQINSLEPLIKGKRCIDFGCGNGNFCFALLDAGAAFVAGIDFGDANIAFANKMSEHQKTTQKAEFKVATVYETGYPDASFDFAIQNGVFHHLNDELKAIREANRILKKGGYFWYYTDGEDGISYDLWDTSVHILREVPASFIQQILKLLNISVPKQSHILDGLKATYRHTSYEKMTQLLEMGGFGNFKLLRGGFDTDFDYDVIASDRYGKEKFGEGDLRILAQKLN